MARTLSPGRLLIEALYNTKDKGGVTGMAMYNNKGDFIAKYDMPTADGGDGYGYDITINPSRNALLTASFIGNNNYMRNLGDLIKDGEAMKKFGNTMVLWDLKAMKPKQVLTVPGALLEIRWSLKPGTTGPSPPRRSPPNCGSSSRTGRNEQFLRGFAWDGKELKQTFEVDFTKEKLGRAHHMKFGTASLKSAFDTDASPALAQR